MPDHSSFPSDTNVTSVSSTKPDVEPQSLEEMACRNKIFSELTSDFAYSYRVDPDRTITLEWMSDAVTRALGYTFNEIKELNWYDLVLPKDVPALKEHVDQILSGQTVVLEYRLRNKQGETIWLKNHARPVWDDEEQRVTQFYGIAQDVSEQRKLEALLREETETLETINRIGEMLSAELDLERLVQAATDAATQLTGAQFGAFFYNIINESGEAYTLYTISGVPREMFSKFPMPRNTEVFAPTFNGEGTVRLDDVRKDPRYGKNDPHYGMPKGHLPVVSYLAVPVISRSGEVIGGLFFGHEKQGVFTTRHEKIIEALASQAAIAIDNARLYQAAQDEIESRRRAQQALKESEILYRTLSDAVPQIVWTARPDGYLDYYNDRWYQFTGRTRGQGGDESWTPVLHSEDVDRTVEAWYAAVRTGRPYEIEYRFIDRKSGGYRWFLGRALPLRDENNLIIKWFGTCTDIDNQKRAEETQRFLAQLEESLRTDATPEELMWSVVNALGDHLQVSRCTYAEIDLAKGIGVVRRDYNREAESIAGTYPLKTFGDEFIQALANDEAIVNTDVSADPRTSSLYESVYKPMGVRAHLTVPLMKDGNLMSALSVHQDKPRAWTIGEIELLRTVAERTWLAVENARLLKAERERSEQLASAIQEVHHRVKNNLQAVSALLEMQIVPGSDVVPVEALEDSLRQIKTIALVHDLLARDQPIGSVNAAQVLMDLAKLLSGGTTAESERIPIHVDAEPLWMQTKAATALALVVNELISNAIKHSGMLERMKIDSHDAIEITLHHQTGAVRVTVQDTGPGFPPDFNPIQHANIGLELVLTLVDTDLQGAIRFSNTSEPGDPEKVRGGRIEITLPERVLSE